MTTRDGVRALLDQVPDDALPAVARYLEAVLAGCPPDDPFDGEPLSPEEEAMMAEARAQSARGDTPREERFRILDEIGAAFADESPEEADRQVQLALSEVRKRFPGPPDSKR